ncbi:MAG: EamA family transporter [Chloroflexi bacterium]|nr:EamA family transporter [Chloroflexota bacterium]
MFPPLADLPPTPGIKQIQASIAVIVATVEVPFSAIAAYLFLRQELDGRQIVGTAFVVSGVILLSMPRKTKDRSEGVPLSLSEE